MTRIEETQRLVVVGRGHVRASGLLIGIGIGGLVDGIVLHQLLQWHHLVSERTDDVGLNTLADGLFHGATAVALIIGVALLHRAGHEGRRAWTGRELLGWVLVGWGGFNLVEGLVDHQMLQIHHVRPGPGELWWDLGFLALGAILCLVGALLVRSARTQP
jgi:uncharacterized membrane protein